MAISDADLEAQADFYSAWLTGQVPALADFE